MIPALARFAARLREIDDAGLRRRLAEASGVDFASNDYLGLSQHPTLRAQLRSWLSERSAHDLVVSPASRLLRGHVRDHAELEQRLAQFKGTEAALLFPCGFMANLGLISAIVGSEDRVLSDVQNHASIIDALRLTGCTKIVYPHIDVDAVRSALATSWPSGHTYLITESLFSMDGDIAPLDQYADLVERYGANLIVDDAHATGLYGAERCSGLVEHYGVSGRAVGIMSTFGKALSAPGACVAGPALLVDYLINTSRGFLYTTATPPISAALVQMSLDVLAAHGHLAADARERADVLRRLLRERGLDCLRSEGCIVPVVLGTERRTLAVAEHVRANGFDVRAVRPPTVPQGTSRLRISVHADHALDSIRALADLVANAAERFPPEPEPS